MAKRPSTEAAKSCSRCLEVKPNAEFYFRSDKSHLLQSHCKSCVRAAVSGHSKQSQKKKERDQRYHAENREKRVAYAKKYNSENKHRRREYSRKRYHSDPAFRIESNLRNRTRLAIKRGSASPALRDILGCDIYTLRSYLSARFSIGMSWSNFGEWEIDHITPCDRFDMLDAGQRAACFHHTNLQPLWKSDNRRKANGVAMAGVGYR